MDDGLKGPFDNGTSFTFQCYDSNHSSIILQDRSDLNSHKKVYAKNHKQMKNLEEVVNEIKPTALIGKCWQLFPVLAALQRD